MFRQLRPWQGPVEDELLVLAAARALREQGEGHEDRVPTVDAHLAVGYVEDGPNLVTLAMNVWGEGEPAWSLNLQAQPDATVELADGPRLVRARAATPNERPRPWARWSTSGYLDAFAARRSGETAVVILEPRSAQGS